MIGLLGGLISPMWVVFGGGALAAALWALIEGARRRRAAAERDAWRARAEGAERHAEASGRIVSSRSEIDRRVEGEIQRAGRVAAERRKSIGEAESAEELAKETNRIFSSGGGLREGDKK